MTVASTGLVSLVINYGALTIAGCSTFQDLVGAADAASALPRIIRGESDETNPAHAMPRALLSMTGDMQGEKVSTTGFLRKGQLECILEIPTPEAYRGIASRRDARIWFEDAVGAFLSELEVLAGQPGYLNIINWNNRNHGRADPKEDNGDEYYVAVLIFDWLG